ncbi:MAG: hypothetical protein ACIPMY_00780 [Rickettsia endosymbiont of Pentastiridius leporinus]
MEIAFANDNFTIIKSGVEESETIVTNGQLRLSNGTEVSVKEE